jgi:hypothetical protein
LVVVWVYRIIKTCDLAFIDLGQNTHRRTQEVSDTGVVIKISSRS